MQRVLVTGNAGTGKTTLVRHLASVLGLPSHNLDSVVWQPGWKKTPSHEKRERIGQLVDSDRWVIDGVSMLAVAQADAVIFLDLPRWVSGWRAARRTCRHLVRQRPEMPARCPEPVVVPRLVGIIRRFPTEVRPRILEEVGASRRRPTFVHIRSASEQRRLTNAVHAARDAHAADVAIRSFAEA